MKIVFESLLPIFLLMGLGYFLQRIKFLPEQGWAALERVVFYILMPAFLTITLYQADFSRISLSALTLTFLVSILLILLAGFAIRKPVQLATGISGSSYSSVYQGFCRWNAFIALPIVKSISGVDALPVVALGLVVMIVPINFGNILVVTLLGDGTKTKSGILRKLAGNPLVIGALIGIFGNLSGLPVYQPVQTTFEMLAKTVLPIGLVLVGAGLRLRLPRASFAATLFSTLMKLLAVPALFVGIGLLFGITAREIVIVAMCGSVPSAMAGYILAKELGGDGPLYASIITMQVIFSMITIPLVIHTAQWIIS